MKRFFITIELDMEFETRDAAMQRGFDIARMSGAPDYSVDAEEAEDEEE